MAEALRLTLRTDAEVRVVEGEGVLLHGEGVQAILEGSLAERLAPLLDGRLSADEIVDRLDGEVPAAEAYYALMQLERAAHVVGDAHSVDALDVRRRDTAFWHALGKSASGARACIGAARVAVAADEPALAATFARALAEAGLHVVHDVSSSIGKDNGNEVGNVVANDDDTPNIVLVVARDYVDRDVLAHVAAHAVRCPVLLCRPLGREVWIGPLMLPGRGACAKCLRERLEHGRARERAVRSAGSVLRAATTPGSAAGIALAAHAAAGQAMLFAATGTCAVVDALIAIDTVTLASTHHAIRRRPQCPSCGDPQLYTRRASAPFHAVSRPAVASDGGMRTEPPEQWVARHRHLVGPLTGVAPMLEPIPPFDAPWHAVVSGVNPARLPRGLAALRRHLRAQSAGKGRSRAQALASALGEAIERSALVRQGDEPRQRASLHALAGDAIHPNACMLFSDAQYAAREAWTSRDGFTARVPAPFDPDLVLDWTPVWSLTCGVQRLLPTGWLFLPGDDAPPPGCFPDSNGVAAGTSAEDALLQGVLELVERDAVGIWWYGRVSRPPVDPAWHRDGYLEEVQQHLARAGRELWALDLTTDLGIPVVAAVSRRVGAPAEDILFGFGAHVVPELALSRALTELGQMISAMTSLGDEARALTPLDPALARWLREATVAGSPFLAPAACTVAHGVCTSGAPTHDAGDALHFCRALLERQGLELLALDLTRPDAGVPVARAIVPGLRHFWPRFAPGRLYEVPVRLGWRAHAAAESDLNPVPFFL